LVPFVARKPGALSLRITGATGISVTQTGQVSPADDPWKGWVFEIDLSGDIGGEQNYRNFELDTELNANRTTEAW
jgi:hypothetical protein